MLPESLLRTIHFSMPGLLVVERGEDVVIFNPAVGTRVEGPRRLLELVEFFKRPRPFGDLPSGGGADRSGMSLLIRNALILDAAHAFVDAGAGVGTSVPAAEFFTLAAAGNQLTVFGAPIDAASSGGSDARTGPAKIRAAFSSYHWPSVDLNSDSEPRVDGPASSALLDLEMRRLYRKLPPVFDLGDLNYIPGESSASYGARIEWLVDLILERDSRPVMLGGDHSVSHYALRAFAKKHGTFGIIHFDAHHDALPHSLPGVTHANFLLGALHEVGLVKVLQVGLRGVEAVNPDDMRQEPRVEFVSARDVHRRSPEEIFGGLPRDIPYYLTFDIDCLTPQLAPDTGTPVAGGLGYYEALELVDYAANHFSIGGFDVVEVGGFVDAKPASSAADAAARMLFTLLLGRQFFEAPSSHLRGR